MEAKDDKNLHIVMFPWLAFGHITPYFNLSKLIAKKHHTISFISTPRNIDRLLKLPPNLASSIILIKIPLPKLAELPENAEATMDIHDGQMGYLKKAFDAMEPGLTRFLEETRPDWIIYDFAPHWLPPIAARIGISRAVLFTMNASFISFFGPGNVITGASEYRTKPEDFTIPPKWVGSESGLVNRFFEAEYMVGAGMDDDSGYSDNFRAEKVIVGSEVVLFRDCNEFDEQWLILLAKLYSKPVVPIGLLPPRIYDDDDNQSWVSNSIKKWLDGQNRGSVVYVALGSEVSPSQDQLTELAHGLELSGVPFFWVLREASGSKVSDSGGVSGRGIVWRGWVPQLKILSHDSVGGFLTHCGWNSIVEGLMFGHPLITLPFAVDQGINSRVVAEREVGIEIPRNEEDGSFTRNSVADSVKLVMVEEDGRKFREKAKEIAKIFGDQELHNRYTDKAIEFLENHRRMTKSCELVS